MKTFENGFSTQVSNLDSCLIENPLMNITQSDIADMDLTPNGILVVTLNDGSSIVVENFQSLAESNMSLQLADGSAMNSAEIFSSLSGANALKLAQPEANETISFELKAGQKYDVDFKGAVSEIMQEGGALLITFTDGGKLVLQNFQDAMRDGDNIEFVMNSEFMTLSEFANSMELAEIIEEEMNEQTDQQTAQADGQADGEIDMAALAEQLAGVEPAAGDAGGGGAGSAGGFGFQSSFEATPLETQSARGPIGETELNFNLPEFQDRVLPQQTPDAPPTPTLDFVDQQVLEDNSVFVSVDALTNSGPTVFVTVVISGIPSDWTVNANGGTYDAVAGTWTSRAPNGTNFSGGPILTPPLNSDADLDLTVTATNTSTVTTLSSSASDTLTIIVDAVADAPNLTANDGSTLEDTAVDVDIQTALNDVDSSEAITAITLSGVPAGFALSAGSQNPDGTWSLTQADLTGLQMTSPADYNGTVNLSVAVTVTETNKTDQDFDLTNDTVTVSTDLAVTWTPVADPPSLTVNGGAGNPVVKEDGSIDVPLEAGLNPVDSPNAFLTVTVTGIPTDWGFSVPVGTYTPGTGTGTGTWTYQVPAGQDLTTDLTFTPPAESDVDLTGLTVTVTSTEPSTGTTSTVDEPFSVIVDAVADDPELVADDDSGIEGTALDVDLAGTLGTDTDGSEDITGYQISGVPDDITFSAGTNEGGGIWSFTPAQIVGLTATPTDSNFSEIVGMTATVFTAETPTDGEPDTSDNTNSASDPFTLTWTPVVNPPSISANGGVDEVLVKEDGTVDVALTANLGTNADTDEFLTVTVTGIDSSWGFSAPVGSYDAGTGTWTYQVPAGQNLATNLTFTPPAESDVDLSGLVASVTSTDPSESITTAPVTDSFFITVDAVADDPTLNATGDTDAEGTSLDIDLAGLLGTDRDGSESITGYQISGVPSDVTFSAGTSLGGGFWNFTPAQIAGLTATHADSNFSDAINLTATVFTADTPTDGEYDTSDNTNSATDTFTLNWTPVVNPPGVKVNGGIDEVVVKEDGTVDVPLTATLGTNADADEFLTVTVTGIDPSWGFSVPVGTYDAGTGTWTYQVPDGQNLSTNLTFTPPAESDVDLTGLVATVTSTDPSEDLTTAPVTDSFFVTVDAVADDPTIVADGDSGVEGETLDVDLAGTLGTDQDGSESITGYQISGVPSGLTFSAGTNQGGGIWSFTPAQIVGLTATPTDSNFSETVGMTATVFTVDTPTDGETDTSDNTNSASDPFTLSWTPVVNPPSISANGGVDEVLVKEDGTVDVALTANLGTNADTDEFLTVTVTGIDSSWGFSAPVGSYDAGTGTWTYQVPAGQNLATNLTFTPPAESDVDLSGLVASVTSTDPSESITTAPVTDSFFITVDAVADDPTLTASGGTEEEGTPIDVDLAGALGTDRDGSESITEYQISNVPTEFTFNNGTNLGGNVWSFTPAQIVGLQMVSTDSTFAGALNLTATVFTVDTPTDGEFDTTDNTNSATAPLKVIWTDDDVPEITPPAAAHVDETLFGPTQTVNGQIVVSYGDDAPGAVAPTNAGSFSFGGSAKNGNLTSDGQAVTVALNGSTYTGTRTDGTTVFTLQINTNGSYTFVGRENLDHQDNNDPDDTINLTFGFDATDSDGSVSDGSLTVRWDDDGPVAQNDSNTLEETDTSVGGNVYDNDDIGTDFTTDGVVQVRFGGTVQTVPFGGSATIQGQYGTLVIDSQGEYTYTLNGNGNGTDVFTYMICDTDQDTDIATLTIKVTPDDIPVLVTPPVKTVDESNMSPNTSVSGTVQADFGGDAPGTFAGNGNANLNGLTSNGLPINVAYSAGVYTGSTTAGTVFTLAINSNGAYAFNLVDTVDHPIDTNPNDAVNITFGVTASDSDNDSASTNITIRILDDGPVANDDINLFDLGGGPATGNVVTGLNGGAGAADDLSQDQSNTVTKVSFEGNDVNVNPTGTTTINGDFGTLNIASNGSYTYTLNPGTPSSQTEYNFSINNPPGGTGAGDIKNVDMSLTDVTKKFTFEMTVEPSAEGFVVAVNGGPNPKGHGGEMALLYFDASGTGTPVVTAYNYNGLNVQNSWMDGSSASGTQPADKILSSLSDPFAFGDIKVTTDANGNKVFSFEMDAGLLQDHAPQYGNAADWTGLDFDTSVGIWLHPVSNLQTSYGADGFLTDWDFGSQSFYDTSNKTATSTTVSVFDELKDSFEYTLTDGDGDTSTATIDFCPKQEPVDVSLKVNNNVNNVEVPEDGTVFVPLTASFTGGDGNESLTLTLNGVSPSWNLTGSGWTASAGGTYTLTLPAGTTSYNGGFNLRPPAQSDIDLNNLSVTANVSGPDASDSDTTTDDFDVIVDAVADKPDISVSNVSGNEGTQIAVNLNGSLGVDRDGSENITGYQVTGVPNGFSFNQGTNNGGGVWSFTPAQVSGLKIISGDAGFDGTLNLTGKVFTTENPVSDGEFDTSNNNNSDADSFKVTWKATIDQPTIKVNNGVDQVKVSEDGSVNVNVRANLGSNADSDEFLTVTVTGIGSGWGVSGSVGSYNAATGTWTYQVPAGQNLNTNLTFTPPAQSDIDLRGLTATVVARDASSGQTATANDGFFITVDAVADKPDISVSNVSGNEGTQIAVNLNGSLGVDRDGSENITGYQVTGVPNGFSFNQGTNNGGGVWSFTPAQVSGLKIISGDAGFDGTLNLTGKVFTTENPVSDGEFDTSNNNNSDADSFKVTWKATIDQPTIKVNNGVDQVKVSEDGSVNVNVRANLGSNADSDEFLTVTVTGIDPGWGVFSTVGNFNASTGTWTYQVPAGQSLNTNLTFRPPAQSDIDLTGLVATAVARDASSGQTATANDGFFITVDAVADKPDIKVSDVSGNEGTQIAVNLNGSLGVDRDGSENITGYQVTGVPNGFSFNQGTNNGGGTWSFTPAQANNLKIISSDSDYTGSLSLTGKVFTTENPVSDGEFNPNNNNNSDADGFKVTWKPDMNEVQFIVGENVGDRGSSTTPYRVGGGDGTIEGRNGNDVLIGDVGGSTALPNVNFNVALMLDVSGSMGSKANANSKLSLLIDSVENLFQDFNGYNGGTVKVHIVPFGSNAFDGATFNVSTTAGLNAAINYLNAMPEDGFTNYEAAMQKGITWLSGNQGGANTQTISYFVSDGQPNYYLNNNGSLNTNSNPVTSMNQIRGTDGSNEIAQLKAVSDEVIGVGIDIGNGILNIDEIDSDGNALNIDDANDLSGQLLLNTPLVDLENVGNDTINGGNGSDLIFGDSVNTDTLALAKNLGTAGGLGWEVFEILESTAGNGWNRQTTLNYIKNNSDELSEVTVNSKGESRSGGNDILNGGAGNDTIYGQEGNDTIDGGAGDDKLHGDSAQLQRDPATGNDTIRGGDGNDFIDGGAGNDALYGDAGNDVIYGWTGNDRILGGAGNDELLGEYGNDTITGGAGADRFWYLTSRDGQDSITDFNMSEGDALHFGRLLFGNYNASQDAIDDFVFTSQSGGNTTVSVDINGSGNAANANALVVLQGVSVSVSDLLNNNALITTDESFPA